jgi:outer membrane immunogenic protein
MSTSALAADVTAPAARPVVTAPVFSWNGFYVGGHVGGAWVDGRTRAERIGAFDDTVLTSVDHNGSGVFGGGQLGYNWVVWNNWLVGFEGDGGWIGIDDNRFVTGDFREAPGDRNFVGVRYEGYGTFTGRLGYVYGPWLLYAKGGGVVASIRNRAGDVDRGIDRSDFTRVSNTETGWTAGGGVEWAFALNWTAKVEYLWMDFSSHFSNNIDNDGFRHDNRLHTVKFGLNYKFNQ